MSERICSHCGTALLVGLRYCPGCLKEIEDRRPAGPVSSSQTTDAPHTTLDIWVHDLHAAWAGMLYPLKSALCQVLQRPIPEEPPAVQSRSYRAAEREQRPPAHLYLTPGYTRVVCPQCLAAQRATLDLLPSAIIVCEYCKHPFPGSFAAEFRKGADLMCGRCGVTSFCVSGLRVTTCPNCKLDSRRSRSIGLLKPKVLAIFAAPAVLVAIGFGISYATHSTSHFLLGLCVFGVESVVGFVTLAALGA
ncbi:MAG: hypothetical protein P4L46_05560 [Fimbriimonas sp.]|nr:hypothetical protein [Fimbriimonas sp.]